MLNSRSLKCGDFELWRDEVNAKCGIKAGDKIYKVNLVTYDDERKAPVSSSFTRD